MPNERLIDHRCEHCNGSPAVGTKGECQWCGGTGLKPLSRALSEAMTPSYEPTQNVPPKKTGALRDRVRKESSIRMRHHGGPCTC